MFTSRPHRYSAASHRSARVAAAALTAAAVTLPITGCAGGRSAPARGAALQAQGCIAAPVSCYTPRIFDAAYGVTPLLKRGINGKGQTVVLPELAQIAPAAKSGASDIRADLKDFDALFHLPDADLTVDTAIAGSSAPYLANLEEVQDVEVLHAIAPRAAIEVVLVPANATATAVNFTTAVDEVVKVAIRQGASVVSISASYGERYLTPPEVSAMHAVLRAARAHAVTVIASSGDSGAVSDQGPPREVSLPASDPLVLGVGGTSLDASLPSGAYLGEVAWNTEMSVGDDDASGGGFSSIYSRPSYQDGVAGISSTRGVPDVSADADVATGMAVVLADGPDYQVNRARGTSASTPLWAGIVALADQEAGRHLGFVNAGIYRVATSPAYTSAFHDVTSGDNTVLTPNSMITGYRATTGWDPVTGWGSPNAQHLVPLLPTAVHHGDGAGQ
jgi:subtilase family serine protease